jgi:hypothetical protein
VICIAVLLSIIRDRRWSVPGHIPLKIDAGRAAAEYSTEPATVLANHPIHIETRIGVGGKEERVLVLGTRMRIVYCSSRGRLAASNSPKREPENPHCLPEETP